MIDEKKVLRGMKRELGLREERVREFGFFEDGQEEEDEEVDVQGEETDDQFSARGRTRCGRLSRLPLRISTADNTAGGNLDAVAETQPAVAEVVPECRVRVRDPGGLAPRSPRHPHGGRGR